MRCLLLLLCGLRAVQAQPSPEMLIEQGHFKRARVMVEARFAQNANDPETLYLMSWIKQGLGDSAAAQQLAERAVTAAPNVAKYHCRLAEAVGAEAQKASTLRQIGLGRRFKKEVDTTLALDPKHTGALNMLMQYYLQAPGVIGGDKKKAHEIPAQIAAVDPVKGVMAEISLARHDTQHDRLEGLYRKAVELRPGSYDAKVGLGSYLINADVKHAPEAERLAREALKTDATRIGGHGLLSGALAAQGKWAEVEAALAQAEKDVPDNLVAGAGDRVGDARGRAVAAGAGAGEDGAAGRGGRGVPGGGSSQDLRRWARRRRARSSPRRCDGKSRCEGWGPELVCENGRVSEILEMLGAPAVHETGLTER